MGRVMSDLTPPVSVWFIPLGNNGEIIFNGTAATIFGELVCFKTRGAKDWLFLGLTTDQVFGPVVLFPLGASEMVEAQKGGRIGMEAGGGAVEVGKAGGASPAQAGMFCVGGLGEGS